MVNKYLYAKGGAETYFLKVGRYFENNGHKVEYFGMYDKKNSVYNSANQYTMNMDFHNAGFSKFIYPFKIIYSIEARKKISKVIDNFKPDIIHLNNINFQLTPSIIDEAYRKGIPVVQTVHDYQMICPNHMLYNLKDKKTCEKCIKGSPWNCMNDNCLHGSKVKSIIASLEAVLYRHNHSYKKVKKYICPSEFLEKKLLQVPIYQGKTIKIHNFIELQEVDTSVKKENYVLYFGRLSNEKGFEMFLECCKKLDEIPFVVAGTGPLEEKCKNIANVKFVGFKTGEELKKLIEKAKFSVYPSIWYENCPLSILESESLGTPVIATNMGGISELIEHNETGILLKEVNEICLENGIKELFFNNEKLKYLSQNCINKRAKMISLEEYCHKIYNIYEEAIAEK